ncbi:hypothetical protein EsH8_III_000715 [Colletotrichum jinshuiense]
MLHSAALASDRSYSKSANAPAAPAAPVANTKPLDKISDQSPRARSPRRGRKKPPTAPKTKENRAPTPQIPSQKPAATTPEEPAGPDVIRQVFESLKNLEDSYASINTRLSHVQEGTRNGVATGAGADSGNAPKTEKLDVFVKRQTSKLSGRLKTIRGTLDVLKSVLNSQQIPLDHLTKRPSIAESSPKATEPDPASKQESSTAPPKPTDSGASEVKPMFRKVGAERHGSKVQAARPGSHKATPDSPSPSAFKLEKSKPEKWTSIAGRMARSDKVSLAAAAIAAVGAASSANEPYASATAKSVASKPAKRTRKSKDPVNVQRVKANHLELVPVEIPDAPEVAKLAYGLDRVLFNPGVYHMQDPRSRVYNFDPYLANIMPINEFDFNALQKYVTSSKDNTLISLAAKLGKKYSGSTSSMTQMLSHFHYLLSAWRPVNAANLSRQFNPDFTSFTQIMRAPAAAFLHLRDDVYAIDADKEYDTASILSMLGKSMEKLLTLPKDEFERYRRANSDQITEEERNADEAFHFTTMGDFLMRSQLDAYDPRLPGSGMFDLKTRAVVSIRMDAQQFQKGLGYEIRHRFGQWESFEREYYDMIRAAFLKYSLQVRMGRMDGIFVAFHNTQRIFGFQYVSLNEMDLALHGTENRDLGDQEFKLSVHLLNKVLDRATERYPGRSIRLHVETRPTDPPFMYIFAKPVTGEEIEKIQTSNQAAIAEYEQQILGLAQEESEVETPESESEQPVGQEEETISVDEARNQQWQTQAFWEEMQEKVDEAVENDALGISHVREAIQDALEQSGLLKARTPEEARGYVDGLLEALTRNQATEARDNDAKDEQETDTPANETGISTVDSAQGDGLSTLQEGRSSSGEATPVVSEITEAQASEDVEIRSDTVVDRNDSESRGSRDLGLKDLILRVATRVDEKPEVEEAELPEDDAASDVSKLRTFERILSELVARSRQSQSDSAPSASPETEDVSAQSDQDVESSEKSTATSTEALKDSASDAGAQENEETDTELDISQGELLGMVLTVRNKVNGQYASRPDPQFSELNWSLEYSIDEIPTERAKTIYKSIQARRKKVLKPDKGTDREKTWHSMWQGKLDEMSKKGRQFRKQEDARGRESPVHVVDQKEPLTWDEAFSHQAQWKPLTWDEPKDS